MPCACDEGPVDPEAECPECGGPNPAWSAPNALWNQVMGNEGGIICPTCFAAEAKQAGIDPIWRFEPTHLDGHSHRSCPASGCDYTPDRWNDLQARIVLFDVDGVLIANDGTPTPGMPRLIDVLLLLGFDVRFWSAGGPVHVANTLQKVGIYGAFKGTSKPTYPPTEGEALALIGQRPALQIDDDPSERVADWPFMQWPTGELDAARETPPADLTGLRRSMVALAEARQSDADEYRDAPDNINAVIAAVVRGWIARLDAALGVAQVKGDKG